MTEDAPGSKPGPSGIFLVHPIAGLASLLAVLAPLRLLRASFEASFWLDESHSVLLAAKPFDLLVDATAVDAHPPLYYILLKAWIWAAETCGLDGPLAVRGLGFILWVMAAIVCWMALRRLLGAAPGTLAAWAVAGCAVFGYSVRETRNYAVAVPALLICFLLLAIMIARPPASQRGRIALWVAYGFSAAVALWTHLLCAPVLGGLGLAWLAATLRVHDREFTVAGFVAQAAALASFVPWIAVIAGQLEYVGSVPTPWMTEPTAWNLYRVFGIWMPLGSVWESGWSTPMWSVVIGAATWLTPVVGAVVMLSRRKRDAKGDRPSPAAVVALGGLAIPFLTVLFLWLAMKLEVARVFHGPRYPMLVAPIWCAGLVALCAWTAKAGRDGRWLWLAAPLLAGGLVAQGWSIQRDAVGGLPSGLASVPGLAESDAPLYVFPPELTLPFAGTLEEWGARPIEEMADAPPGATVHVLDLKNLYVNLERPEDALLKALMASGALAESHSVTAFPAGMPEFALHRLEGFRPQALDSLTDGAWRPANFESPGDAVSIAFADRQFFRDGWLLYRADAEGRALRWAARERVTLRFDSPLPPGRWSLIVEGVRLPQPAFTAELGWRFEGEPDGGQLQYGPGKFLFKVPFSNDARIEQPRVDLLHPTWSTDPADHQYLTDELSFLFSRAWFEPPSAAPSPSTPANSP